MSNSSAKYGSNNMSCPVGGLIRPKNGEMRQSSRFETATAHFWAHPFQNWGDVSFVRQIPERHTTHLRLLDKLTCDCTSLATARPHLRLQGPQNHLRLQTPLARFGGRGGANINARNVEVAPQLATTILWNQGCIGDSRMMWLVLLMRSMHAPPQLQASRSRSYK